MQIDKGLTGFAMQSSVRGKRGNEGKKDERKEGRKEGREEGRKEGRR